MQSGAPAFGQASSPAFGQASSPAFGSTFGQTTSAFGASSPGLFGKPASTPAFGQSSSPFGSSSFGATSTPAFGQTGSVFGASTPAFGQSQAAFGSTGAAASLSLTLGMPKSECLMLLQSCQMQSQWPSAPRSFKPPSLTREGGNQVSISLQDSHPRKRALIMECRICRQLWRLHPSVWDAPVVKRFWWGQPLWQHAHFAASVWSRLDPGLLLWSGQLGGVQLPLQCARFWPGLDAAAVWCGQQRGLQFRAGWPLCLLKATLLGVYEGGQGQ